MNRTYIVPKSLVNKQNEQNFITLKNMTVVQSCSLVTGKSGTMFLDNHLLLVVLKGTYSVTYNGNKYTLRNNEMVFLKKAISIEYDKRGDPLQGDIVEVMMFFLKDEILKEFEQKIKINIKPEDTLVPVSVIPVDERLNGFIESLKPYFNEKNLFDENLIKLKMFELLYDLGNINKNLLSQILQLSYQTRQDLDYVLESNYLNPVSLEDLAYLSGRSLSSFKRDFNNTYKIPPSQWIRERRLRKAKEFLTSTEMTITDICFATGFENVSHFSRLFKDYYGNSPSTYKKRFEKVKEINKQVD